MVQDWIEINYIGVVLYHPGPQRSNFLLMDLFEYFFHNGNSNWVQIWFCTLFKMSHWTTDLQWTNFSFLTWISDGDSKSDIILYPKWLSEPQNFVIMICCTINFDIIWYSVIFAVNLYLLIFVWSSDILIEIYIIV